MCDTRRKVNLRSSHACGRKGVKKVVERSAAGDQARRKKKTPAREDRIGLKPGCRKSVAKRNERIKERQK